MPLGEGGVTLEDYYGDRFQPHGVAAGADNCDAVNAQQLEKLAEKSFAGIAMAAAIASGLQPYGGHEFDAGMRLGSCQGVNAFAGGAGAFSGKNRIGEGKPGVGNGEVTTSGCC